MRNVRISHVFFLSFSLCLSHTHMREQIIQLYALGVRKAMSGDCWAWNSFIKAKKSNKWYTDTFLFWNSTEIFNSTGRDGLKTRLPPENRPPSLVLLGPWTVLFLTRRATLPTFVCFNLSFLLPLFIRNPHFFTFINHFINRIISLSRTCHCHSPLILAPFFESKPVDEMETTGDK